MLQAIDIFGGLPQTTRNRLNGHLKLVKRVAGERVTFHCLSIAFSLPFLDLPLPFLDLPLPFHCLSLTSERVIYQGDAADCITSQSMRQTWTVLQRDGPNHLRLWLIR